MKTILYIFLGAIIVPTAIVVVIAVTFIGISYITGKVICKSMFK